MSWFNIYVPSVDKAVTYTLQLLQASQSSVQTSNKNILYRIKTYKGGAYHCNVVLYPKFFLPMDLCLCLLKDDKIGHKLKKVLNLNSVVMPKMILKV